MGFSAPQARNFWGYGVYSYDFLGSINTFFALHYPYRTPPGVGGPPPETEKIKASFHVLKKLAPYVQGSFKAYVRRGWEG